MSCKPDLSTLISEIEWLVKNHSRYLPRSHERPKPCTKLTTACEDESYSMKITLDVFVKLHQMLHNYIGLLNFRGPKSRDFDRLKIPLNEALDVAVRAMISAMQSSAPKQPSSTRDCLNCFQSSECSRRRTINSRNKCDFDKLSEIEEVDKKLLRLKAMTLESVENVEVYIKDALHAITKLPLSAMTSRLEILSSVVRNTKNKLTSCGRRSAASLMRTQVNPISQIVSEFIQEYGQIKSKVYPCRKICRFCGSFTCPMDRRRNIFCCENSKHLNFLWKEWIQQNSVKGVAKWDEDTIMSIVDSIKDTKVAKHCLPDGPCANFCRTAGQRSSSSGLQDGGASSGNEKGRRGDPDEGTEQRNKILSNFSQGGGHGQESEDRRKSGHLEIREKRDSKEDRFPASQKQDKDKGRRSQGGNYGDGNRPGGRGQQDSEEQNKSGRSRSGKKRDSQDPGKEGSFRASQIRDKDKGRGTNSHNSNIRSVGEHGVSKSFDPEKTSRKKGSKKDAGGADLNDQDYSPRVNGRQKSPRSGKADPRKTEDDLHPENKRRGKSNRKKEGESMDHGYSGNRGIGNTSEPSGLESSKKGRDSKNPKKDDRDGQAGDDVTLPERGSKGMAIRAEHQSNRNDTIESKGSEKERLGKNDGDKISPGTKTRGKYGEPDGKRSSGGELESKSGKGDSGNLIEYQLSNKLFVELGWTLLPKDRIMRRVVEFQGLLAKPHMNWFKNNRIHGRQYYTDGKTVFTNFLDDGSGHVYYPNGQTAISAQVSKKGTHELYKVYAMGGRDVMGVKRLPWLMGVFDSMGNGVVYDENCNIRVTYNQHGGVYLDNPAKVPFSWGWNNFQTFPIDQAVYEDPLLDHLPPELLPEKEVKNINSKASKHSKSSKTLSYENVTEDQASSERQESKPSIKPVKVIPRRVITPLKPICLKMNKYLSLRILDRKNINLQFFAGQKYVRIELGTEVDPEVQINSELVDRDDRLAKMTKNRLHMDVSRTKLDALSPDSSLLEIAKEFQRAKNEANSRKLMINKYRPHLISPSFHP